MEYSKVFGLIFTAANLYRDSQNMSVISTIFMLSWDIGEYWRLFKNHVVLLLIIKVIVTVVNLENTETSKRLKKCLCFHYPEITIVNIQNFIFISSTSY